MKTQDTVSESDLINLAKKIKCTGSYAQRAAAEALLEEWNDQGWISQLTGRTFLASPMIYLPISLVPVSVS